MKYYLITAIASLAIISLLFYSVKQQQAQEVATRPVAHNPYIQQFAQAYQALVEGVL